MARNAEKRQSTLNRWLDNSKSTKDDSSGINGSSTKMPKKRPYLASNCNSLVQCEKWRYQILKEIGQKVTDIQNSGLGEQKLREMNDEINKLIREKGHWERRILDLGGPNYLAQGPKISDDQGREAPEARGFGGGRGRRGGYRYFGAARNLPGVKDLFPQEEQINVEDRLKEVGGTMKTKSREEMLSKTNMEYYGLDDDDHLIQVEKQREGELRSKAILEYKTKQQQPSLQETDKMEMDHQNDEEDFDINNIPSQEDISKLLKEQRSIIV